MKTVTSDLNMFIVTKNRTRSTLKSTRKTRSKDVDN